MEIFWRERLKKIKFCVSSVVFLAGTDTNITDASKKKKPIRKCRQNTM